jgi:hypothetical protein
MTKIIGVVDRKTRYFDKEPDEIVQVKSLSTLTKRNIKVLEDLGWKFEKTARVWFVRQDGRTGAIKTSKSFLVLGKTPKKETAEFWMYYTAAWSSGRRAIFVNGTKYFGKGGSSTFGVDIDKLNAKLRRTENGQTG